MLDKLSLKAKIVFLGVLVTLALLLLGWSSLNKLSQFHQSTERDFHEVSENVELLTEITHAHVIFKIQVQEWKNVLIHGNDAKQYVKYSTRFQENSDKVQAILAAAIEKSLALSIDTKSLYNVKVEHANLKKSYLAALEKFDLSDRLTGKKVDKSVSGVDRPASKGMSPTTPLTIIDLKTAIENREITLHYQPKLTVKGLLLKGVEALARWQHPIRGFISPVEFIDAAERLELISPLTEYLFDIALKQKAQWSEHGINFHLSFNLSPLSLTNKGLAESITQQVESYKIPPKDIVLEITENAISGEISTAIETLAKLRLKGFNLAIDDYGTGFANAQQLSRVPATELKLDRSLVDNVATNPQQKAILKSTVNLSKDLQLITVAEGVEYLEDFKYIYQLDVDLVQGYYFAKPMTAENLTLWLKKDLAKIRKDLQLALNQ